MSLEEFEARIQNLSKGKAITKEESNDIKRQRRLIKNRQSAMASRERKKEEMTVLREENEALKKEVSYLRSFIDFLTVGKPLENLENAPSVPVLMIFGLLFSFMILLPSSISLFGTQNGNTGVLQNSTLPVTTAVQNDISSQIKHTKIYNYNQHLSSMSTSKEFSPLRRELLFVNDFNDTSVYDEHETQENLLLEKLNAQTPNSESFDLGVMHSSETHSPSISL